MRSYPKQQPAEDRPSRIWMARSAQDQLGTHPRHVVYGDAHVISGARGHVVCGQEGATPCHRHPHPGVRSSFASQGRRGGWTGNGTALAMRVRIDPTLGGSTRVRSYANAMGQR
jgi:hypothetical protein